MYTLLQIVISVIVVYLIFSTMVMVIVEWLSTVVQLRGKMLKKAILDLFKDGKIQETTLGQTILDHPRILGAYGKATKRLATYIPASSIASALIDSVGEKNGNAQNSVQNSYNNYLQGIDTTVIGDQAKSLLTSIANRSKDIETLGTSIEKWFDESMDRLAGAYKRKIWYITMAVSVAITLIFNVDTVHIIRVVKEDPIVRQRLNDLGDQLLVDSAFKQVVFINDPALDYREDYEDDSSVTEFDSVTVISENEAITEATGSKSDEQIKKLNFMNKLIGDADLPIGWGIKKDISLIWTILGWLMTAAALTAGAPFWFDLLKNLVNIRKAGPKPVSLTSSSK